MDATNRPFIQGGNNMKKKLCMVAFMIALLVNPSFSVNTQEISLNQNLLDSASLLKSKIEYLMNPETNQNTTFPNIIESVQEGVLVLEEQESDLVALPVNMTMFVTGIRGELFLNVSDVPYSIPYSYFRSSDGAYFSGTLDY